MRNIARRLDRLEAVVNPPDDGLTRELTWGHFVRRSLADEPMSAAEGECWRQFVAAGAAVPGEKG